MNYLTLEHIKKSYGEKVLFEDLSMSINKGDKVALIARNGMGKTTLLRLIAGKESPEGVHANIEMRPGLRIGVLEQEPDFPEGATVMEAIFDKDTPKIEAIIEYEEALYDEEDADRLQAAISRMDDLKAWDFESKIKEILTRLHFHQYDKPVSKLSGGQKKRLALARLLLDQPEFLILDEPTNHLDLDMIEWLEQYLQQPNLTIFMVTHDRYFLERVCEMIIELDRGRLYKYQGSYSDYLRAKQAREANESTVHDKNKKLYKEELEWINRQPKARGTKSKARKDRFKELRREIRRSSGREKLKIDLKSSRLGSKIVELHNVSKRLGGDLLFEHFDYKLQRGEAIGISGPNGSGKTTFLNVLSKQLRPDTGKVVVGDTVRFGYYSQEGIDLKEDKRVIDVARSVADYIPLEKGRKLSAEQLLEHFLFPRDQQKLFVSKLSGGEKRRLYLLTVLMRNPNVLILDEPTNDLDILTLNILEDYLLDFPGCVLVVSHDRYFMDKIVDHMFIFDGAGNIKDFPGNYSQYREWNKLQEREKKLEQSSTATADKKRKKRGYKGLDYEEKKEFKKLEQEIYQLEERKEQIGREFVESELPPDEIRELSQEMEDVQDALSTKEMRWMELAEKL